MGYWILKAILKPILAALYGIKAEGLENVPKDGPAVLAANHVSFLDSFFLPLVIKGRKVTFLAKSDYFKSWKTAWFFRMAGQIPTEREGGKRSEAALETGLGVLREGKLLGIYPEGTRSPDGLLHRGRTGVSRLALSAQVPVIPCALVGTEDVMPKDAKLPKFFGRPKVMVRFGKPIDTTRFANKQRDRFALRSFTDELMYEIMQLSGQRYVDEYASRTAVEPLPEAARPVDDIDLSEEVLAG